MRRRITSEELSRATRFTKFAPVYKLNATTVVKTGDYVRLAEAETMRFISANTTIPVPKVHNAYVDDVTGHAVIIMDFVEGEGLDGAWEHMAPEERDTVIQQLRDYVAQLRRFKGDFIGSVDGSSCNDQYFYEGGPAAATTTATTNSRYGPYDTEEDFNLGMVRAMKKDRPFAFVDWTCDIWMDTMTDHEIVLTHGDLDPRNILVQGSKVVAILDWEYAGFYPEYWEYCKALCHPEWDGTWMSSKAIDRILTPYYKELSVVWNCNDVLN